MLREHRRATFSAAPVPAGGATEVASVRVRKLLLVVAALTMVMALAACSGLNEESSPDEAVAPDAPSSQQKQSAADKANAPDDPTLTLTVPSMERVNNSPIPDTFGDDEDSLRNFAGIHLEGTGFPWQEEANVYIAGHRLGYPNTPSFLVFYDLDKLEKGDEVIIADADGGVYTYEVFRKNFVGPTDLSVTEPVRGKDIVTLQTCTLPDYSQRLIVQAEKVA